MKRSNGRAAFTLVELLVVIGIIALLISIILPAIGKARAQSSTLKCSTQLQQIGVAMRMYSNDYRNSMIPALYFWYNEPPANSYDEKLNWAQLLMNGKYLPQQSNPGGQGSFTLRRTVLMCPDSRDDRTTTYNPSSKYDQAGAAYWRMNQATTNTSDTTYGINAGYDATAFDIYPFNPIPMKTSQTDTTPVYKLHKLNQIKGSSEMVTMFDGVWLLNSNPNRINARHNKGKATNILFADGHVTTVDVKSLPSGNDFYTVADLLKHSPYPRWRLDQK